MDKENGMHRERSSYSSPRPEIVRRPMTAATQAAYHSQASTAPAPKPRHMVSGSGSNSDPIMIELINTREDVEKYRQEYERIQEEGRELYNAYAAKCARVTFLKEKFTEYDRERSQLEQERDTWKNRCEQAAQRTEELRAKCKEQADRIKELQQQQQQQGNGAARASIGGAARSKDMSVLQERLDSLSISTEVLRAENESLRREIGRRDEREREQVSKLSEAGRLRMQVEQLQAQLQAQLRHEEELQQQLELASDNERQAVARADEAAVEGSHLRERLEQQSKAVANLQADLKIVYDKHKRELAQLAERYQRDDYERLYAAAVRDRRLAEEKLLLIEQLLDDVMASSSEASDATSAISGVAARLATERKAIVEQLAELERERAQLATDRAQLDQQVRLADERVAAAAAQVAQHQQAADEQHELARQSLAKSIEFKSAVETLRQQRDTAVTALEAEQRARVQLEQRLANASHLERHLRTRATEEAARAAAVVEFVERESAERLERQERLLEQRRASDIESLSTEHAARVAEVERQLAERELALTQANSLRHALAQELDATSFLLEHAERESSYVRDCAAAMADQVTELERQLDEAQAHATHLTQLRDEDAIELQQALSRIELLSTQSDSNTSHYQERERELLLQLAAANETIATLRTELAQLTTQLQSLESERLTERESFTAASARADELRISLEDAVLDLKGRLESALESNNQLQATLSDLKSELEGSIQKSSTLSSELEHEQQERATLQRTISSMSEQLESITATSEAHRANSLSLSQRLQQMQSELDASTSCVRSKQQEVESLTSIMEDLAAKYHAQAQEMEIANIENSKLQLTLTDAMEQVKMVSKLQLLLNSATNAASESNHAEELMRVAKQELEHKYRCAMMDTTILQGEKQLLLLQLELVLWVLEQCPGQEAIAQMLNDKLATERKLCDLTARFDVANEEIARYLNDTTRWRTLLWKLKTTSETKLAVMQQRFVQAEGEVEGLFALLQHMRTIMLAHEEHVSSIPGLRALAELLHEFTSTEEQPADGEGDGYDEGEAEADAAASEYAGENLLDQDEFAAMQESHQDQLADLCDSTNLELELEQQA